MKGAAETLAFALGGVVAASAKARQCCIRLEGRTIAVETLERRLLILFEGEAGVRVEAGDGEADATLRGSPTALLSALAGRDLDAAAVFGDEALFEDFRESFRPGLPDSPGQLVEDLGDAAQAGARAVRSGVEGVVRNVADRVRDWQRRGEREENEALRARVRELEDRLRAAGEEP